MSTDIQLKGDSRRRQLESSQAYANQNNLDLVDASQMEDIGVSAFKGANVREGALGQFLDAVRAGKVDRGSYLLVESLDRISRQEVRKSLAIFLSIIDAGINIVTLADGRVYTADQTDELDLITSLVIMSRAHDESRTKSRRLSAAWANKRKNAATRPLTRMCPAWVRLSPDKKGYEVIQERAVVVRSIFEDSAAGMGAYSITRRLNQAHVRPFGRSRGWVTSYVSKILVNRAVLGEFQPHRIFDGKRAPAGDPISGYFPAVVDEELFHRAQAGLKLRDASGGGRKGTYISNLFSKLAVCAYCKLPMRFSDKGSANGRRSYLTCEGARRWLGCERTGWRYDEFEASFLAFVQELDLETVARSSDEANKRVTLDATLSSLQGQRAALEQERERAYDLLLQAGTATEFVASKLQECEARIAEVDAKLRQTEKERTELTAEASRFYESREQIKALIHRLQHPDGEEVYKLRAQIASKLRSLVDTILVAPRGHAPLVRRAIAEIESNPAAAMFGDAAEQLRRDLESDRAKRRYFAVGFKDGTVRAVYPSDDDPLKYEEQLLGTKLGLVRVDGSGSENLLVPSARGLVELLEEEIDRQNRLPSTERDIS
jgi:DNA invertase Pin-like site-specific DNA recombinase